MKTTYIGKVAASWIKNRQRVAGIDFGTFSIVVRVGMATEVGDQYRIDLTKVAVKAPSCGPHAAPSAAKET